MSDMEHKEEDSQSDVGWRDRDPKTDLPYAKRTGMEELRLLVNNFNYAPKEFNDRFTAEQLLQIQRMWWVSDWDVFPDQWDERQVQEALKGIVPQWDDDGAPKYTTVLVRGHYAVPIPVLIVEMLKTTPDGLTLKGIEEGLAVQGYQGINLSPVLTRLKNRKLITYRTTGRKAMFGRSASPRIWLAVNK